MWLLQNGSGSSEGAPQEEPCQTGPKYQRRPSLHGLAVRVRVPRDVHAEHVARLTSFLNDAYNSHLFTSSQPFINLPYEINHLLHYHLL